jgi:septum formation protein
MTFSSVERPLVVLGSQSPRRAEILTSLRVPHVVLSRAVDERVMPGEAPGAYLVRVVRSKLAAVRGALDAELASRAAAVLVADTSVIVTEAGADIVLGKPEDEAHAQAMLERLSGKAHEVRTRFALAALGSGPNDVHEETVTTRVTFRSLSRDRILRYVATREGFDKAGGYAVQGMAGAFVERIDGSYSNVVGLPACEVSVALERFGLF